MRLPALCFALLAVAAAAQGKPTVIDHPLDVKTAITDAQQNALQDDFRQLLARTHGILMPTRSNWQAAVTALRRQDCGIRDECLRQLATTAGTLYALYASVERNAAGTELTATGRVVNQDGVQVRAPASVTVKKKDSFELAAREALVQLVAKLELDKLSPVLTPAPEKVTPLEAFPAPPMPPPADPVTGVNVPHAQPGTPGLKAAGYVFGGLAVASGAVAAVFGGMAASARAGLPSSGPLLDESQVRTQGSVNQGATIALAAGVTAGVFAITSIALLAASPSTASVALTPVPGGAAMVVGGRF